ncbi:MAG: SDR family NAD(P)-dependent oxidoreductase [Alphaproteobacteria bacterium]
MTGRLEGKVAIVTGAARGIGEAIARRFVAEGARVLGVDLLEAELAATATALGPAMVALPMDITAADAPERIVAAAETLGPLDVLVNNAGIGGSREVLETSDEDWDRRLDVMLRSVFRLSRAALPRMRRGGAIVNIASVIGTVGYPGASSYSAAKAGVIALTRQMAGDYGIDGIRINAIAPGLILSDMTEKRLAAVTWYRETMLDATPLGHAGTGDDVAAAVLFFASDDARFVTGQLLAVDGGWTAARFHPGRRREEGTQ